MIRQRCHFSIIFESLWQFWAVILLMLFNEIDTLIEVVRELGRGGLRELAASGGIWGLLAVLILTLSVLLIQFLRWRKTWITLDGHLIILERNTLRKVRNTIALENISSVNEERNLFERVAGTARIKLDTGSLTTAAKTDISIVLKKEKADAFRSEVLERIRCCSGECMQPAANDPEPTKEPEPVFRAEAKDLLLHGLYSLPVGSLAVVVGTIAGGIWYVSRFGRASLAASLGGNLAILLIVAGCAWNVVKRFLVYYGFSVSRKENEIHIRYGLLKLRNYTVPVDQIVCMWVEQPPLSRIFHRYQASIVSVGLGNEDGETSNLTLALPEAEFRRQLAALLPEYTGDVDFTDLIPVKRGVLLIKAGKLAKWAAVLGLTAWGLTVSAGFPVEYSLPAWLTILIFLACGYALAYRSAGSRMGKEYCALAHGILNRNICVCPYRKIQYVSLSVHPLARHMNLTCGVAHFLNTAAEIPYMEVTQAFRLAEKTYRNEEGKEGTGFTGQNQITQ